MSDPTDYKTPDGYGTTIGKCLTYGEIDALLAAERERCAGLADHLEAEATRRAEGAMGDHHAHLRGQASGARTLAEAIRTLHPQTEESQP